MRRIVSAVLALSCLCLLTSCAGWRGLNSLPLPGTQGKGDGAYTIRAQLPDVVVIQPNTRVRVADVNIGNVTKIEVQDWHALVTMRINGDVHLPANSTAKVGQTSLLGSMHIELAPPNDEAPQGQLKNGSVIPLARAATYPTTEQTLAAASMFLNGGGLGQVQEITKAFSTAFAGREDDLRTLIQRLDEFIGHLDAQKNDIIAANESINNLAGQFAAQQPSDVAPVLKSLADAGPALTRALSVLPTYPFPKETLTKWLRGDYANLTAVIDLTLSRLDSSFFTGTRFEGDLTELELQWGRTIGQLPSPATAGNPLVIPYHRDQGP